MFAVIVDTLTKTFAKVILNSIYLLYSRNTNISGNIIKHNLRASMNERTHFFIKNIAHTLYSRKGWCFCGVWEMGGETYSLRERTSSSSRSQWVPTLAPACKLVSLAWLRFSTLCLNLTSWFSSRGLLPVTHLLYPSALNVLPCLLIITWQFVRAHGVTRNEPIIHAYVI